MTGATGGLNETFVHGRSPLREVGGGIDHKFQRARHAPLRVNAPPAVKILFTVRREFFNGLRNAAGCRHQHHADRRSVIAPPLREGNANA
jgi:hypothetical protein